MQEVLDQKPRVVKFRSSLDGSSGIQSYLGESGSTGDNSGKADSKPESILNYSTAVWEKYHLVWEHCWWVWKL
jgi:hypothetical protein